MQCILNVTKIHPTMPVLTCKLRGILISETLGTVVNIAGNKSKTMTVSVEGKNETWY